MIEWRPDNQTITSDYYSMVLQKLREASKSTRRGSLTQSVLLQHDNAKPHVSFKTKAAIRELGFEVMPHPAYSPDLAPSDYWLFARVKDWLSGKNFSSNSALASSVNQWVKVTPKDFFTSGLQRLPVRWQKCIDARGDYFE